ncbi:hypothetical protein HanPSC8_Chr15g0675741 [Helianthus annuus]|nr:hypothetical protein HanPSC8_Chr15g0675741 [Helianthus annuus]
MIVLLKFLGLLVLKIIASVLWFVKGCLFCVACLFCSFGGVNKYINLTQLCSSRRLSSGPVFLFLPEVSGVLGVLEVGVSLKFLNKNNLASWSFWYIFLRAFSR